MLWMDADAYECMKLPATLCIYDLCLMEDLQKGPESMISIINSGSLWAVELYPILTLLLFCVYVCLW